MKKKTVLVHPCPKCGSTYLAHGKPYGCATPWLVAWLGSLHGVVCTACGPLQAHGDCLEQGVEKEKCAMMGS